MAIYRCPVCGDGGVSISTPDEMRRFPSLRLYQCPKCRRVYVVQIKSHSPTFVTTVIRHKN